MVANLKKKKGPLKLDLDYYSFKKIVTVVLNLTNVDQDTTLVLLVKPESLIFDKSCIFIDGHFFRHQICLSVIIKIKLDCSVACNRKCIPRSP